MNVVHQPFAFACGNAYLFGMLSRAINAAGRRGVLIAVGGPQYRAGSHRQFKLLADRLAGEGTPIMRFDYRGMGDSSGVFRGFEHVQDDFRAAVDAFFERAPGLAEVVIWGLCDAASASLFYAHTDNRVSGLVLLNPWIRSDASEAQAYLRHYYVRRLFTRALWRKLVHGEFELAASMGSFAGTIGRALAGGIRGGANSNRAIEESKSGGTLSDRMASGLRRFEGPVLLILSGNDLTASEFTAVTSSSRDWRRLLAGKRVTRRVLPDATHTFSSRAWRDQVASWTASWVRSQ